MLRHQKIRKVRHAFVLVLTSLAVGCASPAEEPAPMEQVETMVDPAMQLHHLHGLMAHGFEMAMEGVNLNMLGQMRMTESVDTAAEQHGSAMVVEARALIEEAAGGDAMSTLHESGEFDEALMGYTHDLAQAMGTVLDMVASMETEMIEGAGEMTLHHLHMLLSHAGQMAGQGASLMMSGTMDMAGLIDDRARQHGAAMIDHARMMHETAMKGETMQALHAADTPEGMTATHELSDAVGADLPPLNRSRSRVRISDLARGRRCRENATRLSKSSRSYGRPRSKSLGAKPLRRSVASSAPVSRPTTVGARNTAGYGSITSSG